jgi:hypothetical protein
MRVAGLVQQVQLGQAQRFTSGAGIASGTSPSSCG